MGYGALITRSLSSLALFLAAMLIYQPPNAGAQGGCEFVLGFKAVRDQIPEIVGECVTNQTFNPATGDALQVTTNGLLVWRKADNWTAFTDGSMTWINGPLGLQSRPNSERFPWEGAMPPSAQSPPPPASPQSAAPQPAPTPPPSASSTRPAPAPQRISGRGHKVSDRFNLEPGLAIFQMEHSGRSNFIVHLLDSNGNRVEGLANEIGRFGGATAAGVRGGSYVFDVDADGDWTISIEQPRPASAPNIPVTFTGRGARVTSFFSLPPGLNVARMRHSGESNFIVRLFTADGERVGSLANEIGTFEGSTAVRGTGIHLLVVDADGDWTITIGPQ